MKIEYSRDEINTLNYGVVVEGWESRTYGRVQRHWLKEFAKEEREKATKMYNSLYRWLLVTGTPESVVLSINEFNLLTRLCNFFWRYVMLFIEGALLLLIRVEDMLSELSDDRDVVARAFELETGVNINMHIFFNRNPNEISNYTCVDDAVKAVESDLEGTNINVTKAEVESSFVALLMTCAAVEMCRQDSSMRVTLLLKVMLSTINGVNAYNFVKNSKDLQWVKSMMYAHSIDYKVGEDARRHFEESDFNLDQSLTYEEIKDSIHDIWIEYAENLYNESTIIPIGKSEDIAIGIFLLMIGAENVIDGPLVSTISKAPAFLVSDHGKLAEVMWDKIRGVDNE